MTLSHPVLFVLLGSATLFAQSIAEPPAVVETSYVPPPRDRAREAGVFTLYFENDYFGGTDRHYTNGVKFAWISGDRSDWQQKSWREAFADQLPVVNREDSQKNIGIALGQNIYTPQDTDAFIPDPNDRPYAGWTYLEFAFISKTTVLADTLSFQLGMVGPHSYADDTQRLVHEWINDSRPNGWEYQLHDEPGLNIIFERRIRLFARTFEDTLGVDLIPHAGFSLGNIQTYANLGSTVRLGLNLPSDFSVQLARGSAVGAGPTDDIDPRVAVDRDWSFYLFAGAEGRAIALDVFLDGNNFRDSPRVKREPYVADLYAGIGIIAGRWQLTFTQVRRTQEFTTQVKKFNDFGSVTLSRAF